jgi:glycosyltransferase involved in cell wall biosynthesis
LRIALTHPTYLPERDGERERMMRALGRALAARGHEVTLLTGHPRRSNVADEDGMRVERRWRAPERLPMLWRYDDHVVQVPNLLRGLWRDRFDIVHAFAVPDAWAAVHARQLGGPPVVFTLLGVPDREYLVARRYRLEMLARVMRHAEAVTAPDEEMRGVAARLLLRRPELVPLPDGAGEAQVERYESLYLRVAGKGRG